MNNDSVFSTQDGNIYMGNQSFSGIINRYIVESKLEYPNIILCSSDIQRNTLDLLLGMVIKSVATDKAHLYFHLYLINDGTVIKLGRLKKRLLYALLTLDEFLKFEKAAYLSETEKVDGDYLFALIPFE